MFFFLTTGLTELERILDWKSYRICDNMVL